MMEAMRKPVSDNPIGPRLTVGGLRCVVAGLGRSGCSAASFLLKHGHHVRVTDSRDEPPGLAVLGAAAGRVELGLGGLRSEWIDDADLLVMSPGLSIREPIVTAARARGVPVVGDVEIFASVVTAPVVAVTGSNGKSTVCSMLARMLAGAGLDVRAGGNLGTPALDLLGEHEPDAYILELSSFQLDLTDSLRPRVAALLNVSADHLDRHGDLDAYVSAKARVFCGCESAVYNRDDPIVASLRPRMCPVIDFGLDEPRPGAYGLRIGDGDIWLARGEELLIRQCDLRVRGLPNAANALAALAIGEALGIAPSAMLGPLQSFAGLPHRMQTVTERGGVIWINDSKATNVGAAVAAIQGLQAPIVLIAGGDGKGADFEPLAAALAGRAIGAILIGKDAPRIAAALDDVCRVEFAADMKEAVAQAAAMAPAGSVVLLAPACASLDMYANFAERGDAFAAAAGALGS
jgi:UDP-N-acetylmuramoylalanine--D-glutamate ligase